MARKRKSVRRRKASSARPVKIKMAGTRRRKSTTTRRRKNPSALKRRRTTRAATRRRRNPGAPKRRNTRSIGRRRRNAAFDWQGTLVAFAGVAVGAYFSDTINDGMNKLFHGMVKDSENAAPMLGVLKLAGAYGLLGVAKMYEEQMPRRAGGMEIPVDEMVIAATAVTIKSGLELLRGGDFAAAELEAAQASATASDGTRRRHMSGRRRRRRMRGTIISSPALATQLRMGGTNRLPMNGYMRGSLDVYPQEQTALLRMQGTGGMGRTRSRAF